MLRILFTVFACFFESPRCPYTKQPCPHTDKCGLFLGNICHIDHH